MLVKISDPTLKYALVRLSYANTAAYIKGNIVGVGDKVVITSNSDGVERGYNVVIPKCYSDIDDAIANPTTDVTLFTPTKNIILAHPTSLTRIEAGQAGTVTELNYTTDRATGTLGAGTVDQGSCDIHTRDADGSNDVDESIAIPYVYTNSSLQTIHNREVIHGTTYDYVSISFDTTGTLLAYAVQCYNKSSATLSKFIISNIIPKTGSGDRVAVLGQDPDDSDIVYFTVQYAASIYVYNVTLSTGLATLLTTLATGYPDAPCVGVRGAVRYMLYAATGTGNIVYLKLYDIVTDTTTTLYTSNTTTATRDLFGPLDAVVDDVANPTYIYIPYIYTTAVFNGANNTYSHRTLLLKVNLTTFGVSSIADNTVNWTGSSTWRYPRLSLRGICPSINTLTSSGLVLSYPYKSVGNFTTVSFMCVFNYKANLE